jgi:hypothetical protein
MKHWNKNFTCKLQMFSVHRNTKLFWHVILFRCINIIAKSEYYLLHVCRSVFLFASMNSSTTIGRIFINFKFDKILTRITGTLLEIYVHIRQCRNKIFLGWEMFQIKFGEKIITHFSGSIFFFRKYFLSWHSVEKHGRFRKATDEDMMLRTKDAICMPDN